MNVHRVSKTPWHHYILLHLARDEWTFHVDGEELRLTNKWIGPSKLLQVDTLLVQRKGLFEVSGKRPFFTAKVTTAKGIERSIPVRIE